MIREFPILCGNPKYIYMVFSCKVLALVPMEPNDHTTLIAAIIANSQLLAGLNVREDTSFMTLLSVLIKRGKISEKESKLLTDFMDNLTGLANMPREIKQEEKDFVKGIEDSLNKCTNVYQMIEILQGLSRYERRPRFCASIDFAIEVLKAGSETIYNPRYYMGRWERLANNVKEYAVVDGKGAAEGVFTVETGVGIVPEPTAAVSIIAVAAICGAGQASGIKLFHAIREYFRG